MMKRLFLPLLALLAQAATVQNASAQHTKAHKARSSRVHAPATKAPVKQTTPTPATPDLPTSAQEALLVPYSQRMADAFISWHPDSIVIGTRKTARWDYEQGLMLKALERVWQRTGDPKYFTYIQKDLDQFVRKDGSIRTYKA